MAPLPAKALLQNVLLNLFKAKPGVHCNVTIQAADHLLSLLMEEKIEFFLCAEEQIPLNMPVKGVSLGRFPLSFVVRSKHPLVKSKSPKENQQFPVISAAPLKDYKHFPAQLQPHLSSPPQLIVGDYNLLTQITEQTDAIWATSTFLIADEIRRGRLVEIQPLPNKSQRQIRIVLYCLDRRSLSPVAQRLKELFHAEIESLEKI
jgi:DNA-binding transcriptional LysR family regulator